jgi:gentisate 1,2-dioxygenase
MSTTDLTNVPDLDVLNDRLNAVDFRAGWNKVAPSLWPFPRTDFVPMHWRWSDARHGLDSAGRLIDTELAERRNLFLVNPVEGNSYSTLRTLVAAYQMILPGERARSHRHTPNALRFVLDVPDTAYTIVDGTRIDMRPGDVLLTPGWSWHGHGNDGDRPGYWVDFLDVPTVHLLEPMFLELWPDRWQNAQTTTRQHPFVYPWSDTELALAAAALDPRHGQRVVLESGQFIPTMTLAVHRYPANFTAVQLRTTANQIVLVKSGRGSAFCGDSQIDWTAGDVFAVPSWMPYYVSTSETSELFVVSDAELQRRLGYLREEQGAAAGDNSHALQ